MSDKDLIEIMAKLNKIEASQTRFESLYFGATVTKPRSIEKMLSRMEMCERLDVSIRTFDRLAPDMTRFGLVKVGGQWRMNKTKFENYQKSLEI